MRICAHITRIYAHVKSFVIEMKLRKRCVALEQRPIRTSSIAQTTTPLKGIAMKIGRRTLRRFAPAGLVDAGVRKDLQLDAPMAFQ